jgi:tetratricopeptide (TPR) repeat protein
MIKPTEDIIKKDKSLIKKITSFLDNGKYNLALNLIHKRLSIRININQSYGAILKSNLAGLLIDIGEEGKIEEAILDGMKIFIKDRSSFCKYIDEGSIEYNLGNAKSGLFKIQRTKQGFKFNPESIELLTDAKNHYWRAFKLLPSENTSLWPLLLVNLANTLDTSSRVTEAICYYDLVLEKFPDFPKANACRAQALIWLKTLSGSFTINQIWQAVNGFKIAAKSNEDPKWMINEWGKKRDSLKETLKSLGYSKKDIKHDIKVTKKESDAHSKFRKFCINNHLCLSEHSLYCNCIGAEKDNLTIPKPTSSVGGDFVPRMEFWLNRIKSEFALARLLYFESNSENYEKWESYDQEISFTELYEGERIGTQSEMLRTSFRICFGILDKIAHAICELFDLSDPYEPIYFEKFWNPRGSNLSVKQQERWDKINSIENFPLLALYSQATDLNSKTGEWGNFKDWRNAIEHEILILSNLSEKQEDIFNVFKGSKETVHVEYQGFLEKTLHLLQLTRSAIFNFVFCVRKEGETDYFFT